MNSLVNKKELLLIGFSSNIQFGLGAEGCFLAFY